MLNDKIEIEIYNRKFTVEMEGLSPLEVGAIARLVDERMREIAKESKIVDSSKLAILTAMEIAAEYQKLKSRMEDFDKIEGDKVASMIIDLEKNVNAE
ncbi:MAG: cell division protein ZapA [Elusimicrobiota bacterium]